MRAADLLHSWNAVELRDELNVCRCVRPSGGQAYARVECRHCNGAGVVARPAVEAVSAAPAQKAVA